MQRWFGASYDTLILISACHKIVAGFLHLDHKITLSPERGSYTFVLTLGIRFKITLELAEIENLLPRCKIVLFHNFKIAWHPKKSFRFSIAKYLRFPNEPNENYIFFRQGWKFAYFPKRTGQACSKHNINHFNLSYNLYLKMLSFFLFSILASSK